MDKDREVSQTAPEQKLFVGGHWLDGQEWFEVRDKLSGDVLASVPICEDELLEMSVQAAHDAQSALAQTKAERAGALAAWPKSSTCAAPRFCLCFIANRRSPCCGRMRRSIRPWPCYWPPPANPRDWERPGPVGRPHSIRFWNLWAPWP